MPSSRALRLRVVALYFVLACVNAVSWWWAWHAYAGNPVLIGLCVLVYGFGLRHAVDADHIAAIDNVTRRLMQLRQRPVTVGFWFALGHSTIVALETWAVISVSRLFGRIDDLKSVGGTVGTLVSVTFLLVIAAMNVSIFRSTWRAYRSVRTGGAVSAGDVDQLAAGTGLMSRLFRPLFGFMNRSWYMVPLGFLFGLGFDTATEIALVGISAHQAAQGAALHDVMVFPMLFAAGMSLVDSTDGVLMLGAYQWAFVKPIRKLYYNMTITLVSVLIAVLIGILEAFGLLGQLFTLHGALWRAAATLTAHFNALGFIIIGIFVAAWGVSWLVYRVKGLDKLAVTTQ